MAPDRSPNELVDFDLATIEKLPLLQRLIEAAAGSGPCLDIGIGTGTTTRRVFGGRPVIGLDAWRPNLDHVRATLSEDERFAVVLLQASGDRLPLATGSIGTVLCSEVLEHVEDDRGMLREIARVLQPGGYVVITVPSMCFGFDSYLHLLGVKTVHDFPGPERHVRPGYTEVQLRALTAELGLEIESVEYLFRPISKLVMEMVSAGHLLYQRVVHGRRSWSWSDVAAPDVSGGTIFAVYRRLFPILQRVGALDRLFPIRRGFGIAVLARKLKTDYIDADSRRARR